MTRRRPTFEYRVVWRRLSDDETRSRVYQRRHAAVRCYRWLVDHDDHVEDVRIERRQVGEWEVER